MTTLLGIKNEKIILKLILFTLPRQVFFEGVFNADEKQQKIHDAVWTVTVRHACFKVHVDFFQSNLYSVLEFYHLLHFKFQKLVEKYMYYCICYYIAELLVVTICNIDEPRKKIFTGF